MTRATVVRVGEVRVRPDNVAGTWRPMLWWTLTSRTWTGWLPVNVVVVEHDGGTLLFDTGQSPDSLNDPSYYPTGFLGWIYRRQAQFRVSPSDRLPEALAAAGIDLAAIDTVVVSHLHQDHAGNVGHFPHSRVLVSAEELGLLSEKRPEMHGVLPDRVAPTGIDLIPVDFSPLVESDLAPFEVGHDLLGDGSLVLLPTPGHSAGSMSLFVRRSDAPPLLLVGDVTYDPVLLTAERVPGTGSRAAQLATTRAVNALCHRRPDLVVIAAHDPDAPALVD